MERKEIFKKLNGIFCDVLDLDEVELKDETSSSDIEVWDSLGQIQLVFAIEQEFGIKFSSEEMSSWKNVGEMVDDILKK